MSNTNWLDNTNAGSVTFREVQTYELKKQPKLISFTALGTEIAISKHDIL